MATIIPDFLPAANLWNAATKRGNYNAGRSGKTVKILVIHDTEGSTNSARAHFRNPGSQVSAHYIIDKDGTIYQEVEERDTAYHAGVSAWGGYVNINNVSVGIELEYLSTDNGAYPDTQYRALVELSKAIVQRNHIPPSMVCKHAECAVPLGRKRDPRNFPWEQYKHDLFQNATPAPEPTPQPSPGPSPSPKPETPNPPPKTAGGEAFLVWLLDTIKRWLAS